MRAAIVNEPRNITAGDRPAAHRLTAAVNALRVIVRRVGGGLTAGLGPKPKRSMVRTTVGEREIMPRFPPGRYS